MSAFLVSKEHIDRIVTSAIAAEVVAPSQADEVGRMLWRENLRSVAYRYPRDGDGGRPGPVGFRDRHVDEYRWAETEVLTRGALAKTVACYEYQTCEHPEYQTSEARRLVEELDRAAGRPDTYPSRLDYPDDVPWGW